jgi:hypothetical protein
VDLEVFQVDWQAISATIIVILAALWLVRRVWRIVVTGSRDGACHVGGCGSCDRNSESAQPTPLVELRRPSDRA